MLLCVTCLHTACITAQHIAGNYDIMMVISWAFSTHLLAMADVNAPPLHFTNANFIEAVENHPILWDLNHSEKKKCWKKRSTLVNYWWKLQDDR